MVNCQILFKNQIENEIGALKDYLIPKNIFAERRRRPVT